MARGRKQKNHKKQRIWLVFITVFTVVVLLGMLTMAGIYFANAAGSGRVPVMETAVFEGESIDIKSEVKEEPPAVEEKEAPEGVTLLETSEEGKAVLAFAGDILLDDAYSPMVRFGQTGGKIENIFDEALLREMRSADLFVVNNEFTYTNRGTPTFEKQYTFRAKPENAALLHEMGVDLVSLANNHAYDYGEISLLDTLDTLKKQEIPYIGAGRNLSEAAAPAVYMVGDVRIAIVAATQIERQDNPNTKGAGENSPGVFRCWNPEKLYEAVEQAKTENDIVIAYIHWGTENTEELDWAQLEQARGLARAGADLIIGNHPHCLQKIEYIENVPVVYSLGNYWFNSREVDTCLLKVTVSQDKEVLLQFLPALQKDCKTTLLEGAEKARVIAHMNSMSDSSVIDEAGNIGKK